MNKTGKKTGEPAHSVQAALRSITTDVADPNRRTSAFINRLSEADRRALTEHALQERHAAGAVICREGDMGDALYIVERGQVAVLKEISEGRPALLGYRGPGEILGEMSLVGQQPRSATLIAVEDTELLRIGADEFPELMDEHPDISWAVLNVLNDRLQQADLARMAILQEEQSLTRRLQRLSGEAERLAGLARLRKETVELIAHDLRTPLAVIDGCLQLLQTSLSKESLTSADDVLSLAERSVSRLMGLVDELLTAARQEAGAATLARQPVDVARLLETAVESVQVTARSAGLSLRLETPEHLPQPRGHVSQLERVVGNLLDNAISYTPTGGRIVVAAEEREGEIEFSVTDTGPGVPPEYWQGIFERFTRVPGVEGRRQGFGLGLYFCRQVVQDHGGRIWVEPGPGGVGSRFAFTLPLEDETGHD